MVSQKEDDLIEAICARVSQELANSPVIVFMGEERDKLIKKLEKIASSASQNCNTIRNERDAKLCRLTHGSKTRGLYIIMREFGRGYDLKLLKEALVLVLVNNPTMTSTEVKQMLGRSCRAMGPVHGAVYLHDSMQDCDAWELLGARTTINIHEGAKLLREVILYADMINTG